MIAHQVGLAGDDLVEGRDRAGGRQSGKGGEGELGVGEELLPDAAALITEHAEVQGRRGRKGGSRGGAAVGDELGGGEVGGDEVEGDKPVGVVPGVGGPEGSLGFVIGVRSVEGRRFAGPVARRVPDARGVLEAIEERRGDAFEGQRMGGAAHARGKIPAKDEVVDLAVEVFGRDVVFNGGEEEGVEFVGGDVHPVGGDVEPADVVGGDAVDGGVVGAELDGIGRVGVDEDEGVEGAAAGEEGGRRERQQGDQQPGPQPPGFLRLPHGLHLEGSIPPPGRESNPAFVTPAHFEAGAGGGRRGW